VFKVVKAPFLFICQFDCVVHGKSFFVSVIFCKYALPLILSLAQVLAPSARVIEDRMIALEAFLRDCVALLGIYACSDARAGEALQTLQSFLHVPQHVDAVDPDLIMEQVIY
jgi:hypothetical protein